MEIIQQFAENETYLFAIRQQCQVHVQLSVSDVSPSIVAAARDAETIETVLREPLGVVFFHHHLRSISCLDMIMFLDDVQQFEEIPVGPYQIHFAKRIVLKYLLLTSRLSVYIPDPVRNRIVSRLETATASSSLSDLFATANRSVRRDLLVDAFPDFLHGPLYPRLLAFRAKDSNIVSRNSFDFIRVLGQGGFGKVFAVRKRDTRQMYACKEMSKNKVIERKREKLLHNERYFLTRVEHPFIVGLHYAFQDKINLYFVMDLVTGGELEYHLNQRGEFSVDWTRFFIAGIVLALEHLHGLNIVYRDLKPENVLLDADGFIKLADLGLCSSILPGQSLNEHCGTRSYMAPEQCTASYRFEVDWWALGVLTFRMLTCKNPFTKIWRDQDKGHPKEGIVSSIVTNSIRKLSNLKTSFSHKNLNLKSGKASLISPINENAVDDPETAKLAQIDLDNKRNRETIQRRKTTLLKAMYESTLHDIVWPEWVDDVAKSFIVDLLQIDPNLRLGHEGAAEVKNHPFFDGFDWVRLFRRHLVPPFVPSSLSVNADYVEAADAKSDTKKCPLFADFDYVATTSYQKEVASTMHSLDDLHFYRKHAAAAFDRF